MNFLHTADFHFGGIPAIGKITPMGIREREYDLIRSLGNIKEIARSETTDVLFVSGDIFDVSNPDSTTRLCWSQFLISIIKGDVPSLKKVYIVLGNHDKPNNDIKAVSLGVDEEYVAGLNSTHVEIKIASDIEFEIYNGHGILLVPYSDDPDAIRSKIRQIYETEVHAVNDFVIVGHIEIKEAELGANDRKLKCGFSYKDEIFSHPKLRYAALGHIHKPQSFTNPDNNAVIAYSGSPVSKDFNEATDWRRVIIGSIGNDGQLQYGEVQIPDRDFITIDNGKGLDELTSDIVNGSIIKLKFKGTLEYLQSFNTTSIISRLEGMGALQVKVDRVIIKEIKTDDKSDFRESTNIRTACRTYVERFAPNGLDKDLLVTMADARVKGIK
jgi:exonuclease SbcD